MPESCDPHVSYHRDGGLLILHMNRPEKKNALTQTMYRALTDGIRHGEENAEVHVIVLRGAGECFSSGNDINDFVEQVNPGTEPASVGFMKALLQARKPLVAAVNGPAIGIGVTMLLHCDLVYAARDAWLQMPFTRLGLCPEAGSSFLAPMLMGHQRAAELLLLGEKISAETACQYGLVNAVLDNDAVLEHTLQRAHALAALPAEAVQTTKHLLKRSQLSMTDEAMGLELVNFARLLGTVEAQSALQGFLSKSQQ